MSDNLKRMSEIKRRDFIKGAGAAALTLGAISTVRGANEKIKIGIIGCGGRGHWIANLFKAHGGYEISAGADYFEDKLQGMAGSFGIPGNRLFTGLKCHEKMLAQCKDLDAVAIISPPYFHPEQAAAAVNAGKHVYLAKPIAVDVPGCLSIGASAEKAAAKKLCFLVDFQTRTNEFYREAIKRVHDGQIGDLVCGEAEYQTGRLGKKGEDQTPEGRLRNWVFFKDLSGDIITEQNIHALDVASWILDAPPISAVGTGGRKARVDVGDCWDHFSAIYKFPKDFTLTFNSTQFNQGWEDIGCRIYGALGTIDTHYGGIVQIRGSQSYKGGTTGSIYQEGAQTNIADFCAAVQKGDCSNPTVAPSIQSNLITILGRTASYENRTVTWKEIMTEKKQIVADLKGLKD